MRSASLLPRLFTSYRSALDFDRSLGARMSTSASNSTLSWAFFGAYSRSLIGELCLSLGSMANLAMPTICSYGPASPNDLPPAKGLRWRIVNDVTSADARDGTSRQHRSAIP